MKKVSVRVLSLLLVLCMVIGFVPVGALAAETVLDAAIFCSDVHGSTSDLSSVLSGVKTSGITYSAIGFVGDTCLTTSTVSSTVNSALGYTPEITYSYAASHDTENSADIKTN